MAKVDLNPGLARIGGSIDGFTYRMRDGQMQVYAPTPSDAPPSKAQLSRRRIFTWAQEYAAEVLADPLRRAAYQKLAKERKRPTNTLLVGNYLNPPAIDTVELSGYTGRAGEEIGVIASDDIAVAGVKVEIRAVDGRVFESGSATEDHGTWRYRSKKALPADAAWRVEVTVTNRAGHAAIGLFADPRSAATMPNGGATFTTRPPRAP